MEQARPCPSLKGGDVQVRNEHDDSPYNPKGFPELHRMNRSSGMCERGGAHPYKHALLEATMSSKVSSERVTRLERLRHELSSGQDLGYIIDQVLVLLLELEEARLEKIRHR